jgi:hypothetical protein
MSTVGFKPTISAGKRLQTYASDCTATGTGIYFFIIFILYYNVCIAVGVNNVLATYGIPNVKVGCRRLSALDKSTTQNFKCVTPL